MELETHFMIAGRLDYLKSDQIEPVLHKAAELSRMLSGLTKKLRVRDPNT